MDMKPRLLPRPHPDDILARAREAGRREYVNSPAAGPWRWDLVLIHAFGKAAFGRPLESSLISTPGTQSLAIELGHRAPVPVEVMAHLYAPFTPGLLLDPFMGSGSSIIAAKMLGGRAIGIEVSREYCDIAIDRLRQAVLPLEPVEAQPEQQALLEADHA